MPQKQQSRRGGRPRKVESEEDRLSAQRTHSRRYYRRRLQQADVDSAQHSQFYHHAPYTPATSSTNVDMPAFPATLDDFALPPSNSPEDSDDPGPPLVDDSMWNHYDVDHDVFRNHVENYPSDVDSITSHASVVSEGGDELYDVSSRHCPAEEGRDQHEEGMQELLESVEKSLRISIPPAQGIYPESL